MQYEELGGAALKWPYSVNYGRENEFECDVLVLGGGIAGCWAAIGAARQGAKVILVEKASRAPAEPEVQESTTGMPPAPIRPVR